MKSSRILVIVALVGLVAAAAKIKTTFASDVDNTDEVQMVGFVRLINTAEADFKASNGKYGSISEIAGSLEKVAKRNAHLGSSYAAMKSGSDSEPVAGSSFSLVVSGAGDRFKASIQSKSNSCGAAFFTDQDGMIFEGKALGCVSK